MIEQLLDTHVEIDATKTIARMMELEKQCNFHSEQCRAMNERSAPMKAEYARLMAARQKPRERMLIAAQLGRIAAEKKQHGEKVHALSIEIGKLKRGVQESLHDRQEAMRSSDGSDQERALRSVLGLVCGWLAGGRVEATEAEQRVLDEAKVFAAQNDLYGELRGTGKRQGTNGARSADPELNRAIGKIVAANQAKRLDTATAGCEN